MENIGIYNLVKELKALNPTVKFDFYDQTKSPVVIIFGTAPAESLSYPEGYYYNEKNGITDKHNTKSGLYEYFTYKCDLAHFETPTTCVNPAPKKKSFFARLFG